MITAARSGRPDRLLSQLCASNAPESTRETQSVNHLDWREIAGGDSTYTVSDNAEHVKGFSVS